MAFKYQKGYFRELHIGKPNTNGTDVFTVDHTTGNVTVVGDVAVTGTLAVTGATTQTGAQTFNGDITIGDSAAADTLILKCRTATSTEAGAALSLGATYAYSEGVELRYTISSWAGIGTAFDGMYLRAQSDADISGGGAGVVRGLQVFGVANASNADLLEGGFLQAYIKGDTAETIADVRGLHGEISMDAGRANSITLTEAPAIYGRILSGKVADYTKFHGVLLDFGDMDGGSRTYGSGVLIQDDAESAGTSVMTNGVHVNMAATTGIRLTGAMTTGILIAGTQTDAIRINGAGTNLLAFDAVEGALSTQATALAGLSATHKLACTIDGTGTVYIPLLAAFA